MHINVLYFAVFRERVGRSSEALELPAGARVSDAISALEDRYAAVKALRGYYQVAVNETMVQPDHVLGEGDEVALIPPVAGGRDRHARILDAPLSMDRVVAAVTGPGIGAVVTFIGTVRDHNQGHTVERLEYEAYQTMATRVLVQLSEAIETEWPGVRVAVEHRVGALAIGDAAVVIACAAAHRTEAFTACRAMIDRLKQQAPIWKKEIGPDGEEWIGLGP